MIECQPYNSLGAIRISGTVPNGKTTVTRRTRDGSADDVVLRNGELTVTRGGISITDTEGAIDVPLDYAARITLADRMLQRNHVLTPDFSRGIGTWTTGSTRTLTVGDDPSTASGKSATAAGNAGSIPSGTPPTLVGRTNVSGTSGTSGSFTITPDGTIANGDLMILAYYQVADGPAFPNAIVGWTLLFNQGDGLNRLLLFQRVRVSGESSYTIPAATGANVQASLMWFRGYGTPVFVGAVRNIPDGATGRPPAVNAIGPAVVVALAASHIGAGSALTPPAASSWAGSTYGWNAGNGTTARNLSVGTQSLPNGGASQVAVVTYPGNLLSFLGVQFAVVNPSALSSSSIDGRTIARMRVRNVAAAGGPYRLTGRIKFTTADIWQWSNVKSNGTWAQLASTKATWRDVRSPAYVSGSSVQYANLYVALMDPSTGAYYGSPVRIRGLTTDMANRWVDVSMNFTPSTAAPQEFSIVLLHGTTAKEFAATWTLDQFNVTPQSQITDRGAMWWFSGDTPVPPDSGAAIDTTGSWRGVTNDAVVQWAGLPGASISEWIAPSVVESATTCQLTQQGIDILECEPVLLSDPVSVAAALWLGLLELGALRHASVQEVSRILGRGDPVVDSQVRSWEVGSITLMTSSTEQREYLVDNVLRSGRTLLLRMPDPSYTENNWYIALGDLEENRISPDRRNPMRTWTGEFVRVERPYGLVALSVGNTWGTVKELGSWSELATVREDWLDVMVEDARVSV